VQREILSGGAVELVLAEVRRDVEAQMPAALEKELVSELRQRSARIQHLEVQVEAARRTPEQVTSIIETIVASCQKRLGDLKKALADRAHLRDVFLALFPDGLTLSPAWAEDHTGRAPRLEREGCGARARWIRTDRDPSPPKTARAPHSTN
jgi:hypothetical protein